MAVVEVQQPGLDPEVIFIAVELHDKGGPCNHGEDAIERAASARVPPTPSSTYCASRASGSPMYSREVIQRAARSFSGRSVSSR